MKILIIDDDDYKRSKITQFLEETIPGLDTEEAKSLQSGLQSIFRGGQSFVILDMSMPTFDITQEEDGGRPQAYAGRDILQHMKRRRVPTPVIVVTQYDRFGEGVDALTLEELKTELTNMGMENYYGMIHYRVGYESWKDELYDLATRIMESHTEHDSDTHS